MCVCVLSDPSGLGAGEGGCTWGCGSGVLESAEVGSLPSITSRDVSGDTTGSEGGTVSGAAVSWP